MKYYITDKNMKSTTGIRDIPNFTSDTQRNNWVSTNLLDGKTIEEVLEINKPTNTQILSMIEPTIEIEYHPSLVNKNYIIVQDDIFDGYLFYMINEKEMVDNSNMVTLRLKLDTLMTYYNWIHNVTDFELTQGHSNFMNYFDYEYNGGKRIVEEFRGIERNAYGEGDDVDDHNNNKFDVTMVVYRRLKSGEEGARINGITVPYKIFIAPYPNTLTIYDGASSKLISTSDLLKYYHELADGLTYKIAILNYNFFTANNILGTEFKVNNGDIVHFTPSGSEYNILELKSYRFYPSSDTNIADVVRNSFNLTIDVNTSGTNHFDYLSGLESEKVMIYGQKEFDWPFNRVKPVDGKLTMHIGTFLAPNENKQYVRWNDELYIQDSDNTWDNDTELSVFVNQLNEYKATNPVTSKLDYMKPLASLANPLNYLNPKAFGAGVAGVATQVVGTATNRMNMKKTPNTVKGDTNTYFIAANSPKAITVGPSANPYAAFLTVKAKYKYIGNDRDSVIYSLYRYGASYDAPIYVKNYEEIKRPKFNFIRVEDISNANFSIDLPDEVLIDLADVVANGVRIWNDDFLEYNEDYNWNGDMIENE